jgi:hypothetical protein
MARLCEKVDKVFFEKSVDIYKVIVYNNDCNKKGVHQWKNL